MARKGETTAGNACLAPHPRTLPTLTEILHRTVARGITFLHLEDHHADPDLHPLA
jgi:hypothetical protein